MAGDSIEYWLNLDLKGNEIKNFAPEVVNEEPKADALKKAGRLVSYGGSLYISDGSNFKKLGESGAVAELEGRVDAIETKNTTQDGLISQNATGLANLTTRVSTAEGEIDTLQADLNTAEGEIDTLQSDMTTAKSDITTLKGTVGDASSGLVKDVKTNADNIALKANSADVYTKTVIDGKVDTINEAIGKKADASTTYTKTEIDTTLGSYRTKEDSYDKTTVDQKISNAVSSAYKVKGTVANADALPSGAATGDVYNITAASTYGPAGTNVVWDGTEWDALGGITDLSSYATTTYVEGEVSKLNTAIGKKVDQEAYNTKMVSLDGSISSHAGLLAGLRTDVDAKVAKTDYESKVSSLESSIGTKATKVATGEGTWTGKITVNAEGIVTAGANLTAADVPSLTASKITDFASVAKSSVRFVYNSASGQSVSVAHNLNVLYPHVTVYRTSSKQILYANVVCVDENNVTVSGNADLGDITIVVSA